MLPAIALLASFAAAKSGGLTGSSKTGCSCHGGAATATTTATFAASSLRVGPGIVVPVTFSVSAADPAHTDAGLDVSASAGVLAAGTNTRELSGEITQVVQQMLVGGTVAFDFTWTAPGASGFHTLYGAGNAVNSDGSVNGDGWDLATIEIEVDPSCIDADGDGVDVCNGDCDDGDAAVAPALLEACDGRDNDCDGAVDEDVPDPPSWYADADGDGWGVEPAVVGCDAPAGSVGVVGDCDDARADAYPGAAERCDVPDDTNCDGSIGFADLDADGWAACTECDDTQARIFPGAPETCDGEDEDCDAVVDEDAVDAAAFYADADGDGHGTASLSATGCAAPAGYVAAADDCDDARAEVFPGAEDPACDGVDLDCDPAPDTCEEEPPPPPVADRGCGCGGPFGGGTWIGGLVVACAGAARRSAPLIPLPTDVRPNPSPSRPTVVAAGRDRRHDRRPVFACRGPASAPRSPVQGGMGLPGRRFGPG